MKKVSIPPFIIFLDLLFMFLFIFILNEDKVIEIKQEGNALPANAQIIYKKAGDYYLARNNMLYTKNRRYTYYGNCNSHIKKCRESKKKYGTNTFIAYSKNLQDEIANFSIITLGTGKCSKMTFFITKQGSLNYYKIIDKNPCVKNISGYKLLLENREKD